MVFNSLKLAAIFFAIAANCVHAAETEISEDKTVLGDWTVNVDEGERMRVSAVQTGTGKIVKTGKGALVLEGDNSFSGGVVVNEGTVEPHHGNAFGSGKITLNADGEKECRVAFTKGKLTFQNDLELVGTSAIDKPAFYFNAGTNVWNGKITAPDGDFYMCDNGDWAYLSTGGTYNGTKFSGGSWSNKVAPLDFMTFNGEVNVHGTVYIVPDGHMVFNGPIKCDTLDTCYRTGLFTLHTGVDENFYATIDFKVKNIVRQFNAAYASRYFMGGGLDDAIVHWPSEMNHSGYPGKVYFGNSSPNRLAGFTSVFPRNNPRSTYGNICANNSSGVNIVVTGKGAEKNADNAFATHSLLGVNSSGHRKFNFAVDGTGVNPGFTQVFSNRHHLITGMLGATNGTLRFVGNSSCSNVTALIIGENGAIANETELTKSFLGVTRIAIDATGKLKLVGRSLTETFDAEKLDLELGRGATIEAPVREGEILKVKTLKIDGVQKQCGAYTAADLGVNLPGNLQIMSLTTIATSAEAIWTGAAESDNQMTTLGNWREAAELPDIVSGITKVKIESGEAMIPGEGRAFLGAIENQIPAVTEGKPFILGAEGRTIEVFGAIKSVNMSQMIVAGTIAPPNGVGDQGEPKENGSNTFYYNGMRFADKASYPEAYHKDTEDGRYTPLVLNNATIAKPFYSSVDYTGAAHIYALAGTYNRFTARAWFYFGGWSHLYLEDNSTVEFMAPAGSDNRMCLKGSGTVILSAPWQTKNSGFTLEGSGCKVVLNSPTNWFNQSEVGKGLDIRSGTGTIEFRCSNALMPSHQLTMRKDAVGTIEFNSTTQTVAQMGAVSTTAASIVRGGPGSLVEITGGCTNSDVRADFCAGMMCSVQIEGALSIRMTGTGKGNSEKYPVGNITNVLDGADDVYVLKGKDFKSCGNLEVSGGSLELAADATWKNGTNFIVRGTGTLRLAGRNQLSRDWAFLHVADEGKLYLGGNQYVMSADVTDAAGNVQMVPNDWYDPENPGPFAGHFADGSTGRLRVGLPGTFLILR